MKKNDIYFNENMYSKFKKKGYTNFLDKVELQGFLSYLNCLEHGLLHRLLSGCLLKFCSRLVEVFHSPEFFGCVFQAKVRVHIHGYPNL